MSHRVTRRFVLHSRVMAIRGTTWVPFAIVVAAAAICVGVLALIDYVQEESAVSERVEQRRAEEQRETEREERWFEVAAEESRTLIPELLSGVILGMSVEELTAVRSSAEATQSRTDDQKFWYQENLPIGAQAMYGFDEDSERLVQLQILSRMPDGEAAGLHLAAMHDTYGVPTGMWHCPNTGEVPTRRFTWRRGVTTVMDILLAHGGGVSQTLYIASSEVVERSLRQGQCRPIRDREEARTVPAVIGNQERINRNEVPPGVIPPPRGQGGPQGAPQGGPQGGPPPGAGGPPGEPPPGGPPPGAMDPRDLPPEGQP